MSKEYFITHEEVVQLAVEVAGIYTKLNASRDIVKIYGVPRGGIPVAYLLYGILGSFGKNVVIVSDPEEANLIVDDLVDSGRTMEAYNKSYPDTPFCYLIDKRSNNRFSGKWLIFPWEDQSRSEDNTIVGTLINRLKATNTPFLANDNIAEFVDPKELVLLEEELAIRIKHLMEGMLIDLESDHNTKDTPHRVAKMYMQEVFKGRYQSPPAITSFPNAKKLDEMYLTGPITVRSACSHHLVPIVGNCWIGVVPGDKVIGLSKFNRLVEWIAARPQIQEELVIQIADYLEEAIQPLGIAVVVKATHLCMTWRGVREPMEAKMTTNVMRGVFREKPEARAEFMACINQ